MIQRAFDAHRASFNLSIRSSLAASRYYLHNNIPDIVLCDWLLPDGKGIELLPSNRENSLFPLVLITSHGNEELAVGAMKAGALDYIVKSPETFANMPDFVVRALREWEHIIARRKAEIKLQQVLLQTVESLSLMVEKRDPYTSGHQKKVCQLACAIADEMNLNEKDKTGIYIASILHDIGKISIPAEYLSKPGTLDPVEFTIIKAHPQIAYEMLKSIDFDSPIARIIQQHHEKCDGSGYPGGLKGSDILLEARIITVADVVEAISSHRPYRPALGIEAALEEISSNAGILYDRNVVAVCLELFHNKGFCFALQ
ncbi:MAG: two-component system response regulator [Firmicutes bacterium HGW-Firmicutes-15]|nr:MAG: two-component system response regulator [Firmicutes bacterium HGW-Firmicutes-15]